MSDTLVQTTFRGKTFHCCEAHNRMDLLLHVDAYNDFPCGTPVNPDGHREYCCDACPVLTDGDPIIPKEEWSDNPLLWQAISPEDHLKVMTLHTEKLVRQWRSQHKLAV